jgi:transcriptional regulator with XRE-family HTH domain
MDQTDARGRRKPGPQPDAERKGLGGRLGSARKLAGLTLDTAAQALREKGYPITRAAIGAWETGRNVPDALWLRRLAKLYGSTLDALVWDEAISMEAIQFAVRYDALNERQKRTFRTLWTAYIEDAKSDADVERDMPVTREKMGNVSNTKESQR